MAALVHPTPPQKGREQLGITDKSLSSAVCRYFKNTEPDFIRFKQSKLSIALQHKLQLISNNFQSLLCVAHQQPGPTEVLTLPDTSSAQTPLNGLSTYMSVFQLLFLQLKYPQLAAFWTDMSGFFRSHNIATT